jgi:hypothetical protein
MTIVFYILLGLVGLIAAGFAAQIAMRRLDNWMLFMDRLYNPPGQRPFPVDRPW